MRHVFETMGTVVSLEVDTADAATIAAVELVFRDADMRFSLYRADSELSRVNAGELRLAGASLELRDAYATAHEWRRSTGGAFTPNRPDGAIDLNGVVKAITIEAAGRVLEESGCSGWTLGAGGDILTSIGSTVEVGIASPSERGALIASLSLRSPRRAIATSGGAERGDHIWRGGDRTPPRFVQATVVADDIVTADVLATAIIAGGAEALDRATERWNIDVLTVDRDGELRATPGLRAALAAPKL